MDHVRELQGRLFAVGAVFIVLSAAAYPFFDKIVSFLVAPLGNDHQLVYLTPAGAFSFIIQACMYVGFIGALPAIIYNVYRFVMPVMKERTIKRALLFTVSSLLLVVAGMVFSYCVSLPAALYFLTSFNLYHINPMLTIDSYFSFVMTYMLAGALLFQIPLIMLIINGATPLKPKGLMKYQDKIILGSFIVAAIISPTPDALNQTLLASPIIVMYQVGIILVWLKNRQKNKALKKGAEPEVQKVLVVTRSVVPEQAPVHSRPDLMMNTSHSVRSAAPSSGVVYGIDGFATHAQARPVPRVLHDRPIPVMRTRLERSDRAPQSPIRRSIDGFVIST